MDDHASKVPAVTLGFWIIKILATTLGETVAAVAAQIAARRFHPALYWFVIVATTTAGTTLADYADRSLGIGYLGGSSLLAALLALSLLLWYRTMGSVSINSITSARAEIFYWSTIMFSQTLGTALGDWMADSTGLGYGGGAAVFAVGLAIAAAAYCWTSLSRTALFWAAFVLTRPLGATVGDFLDKPIDHGGLALSRYVASALLAVSIIALIRILPQRAEARAV
jgi:uncharacterized membrane-anchored protein